MHIPPNAPDARRDARDRDGRAVAACRDFPQSGKGAGIPGAIVPDPDAVPALQPASIPALTAGHTPAPRPARALGPWALALAWAVLALPTAGARADEGPTAANLYELHCATCHGQDGRPVLPGAPDFRRPDTLARPNSVLMRAIREGKGAMPAYYGVLSDAQMRQIVNHLRRFQ